MRLRRLLLPALVVPALVGGLLALPVLTLPSAAAGPVRPAVVELPLEPLPRAALRTAGASGPLLLTGPRDTAPFAVVGLTWDATPVGTLAAAVRTRTDGTWSPWTVLEVEEQAADGAEAASARRGTEPLWVGEADGVQARLEVRSGPAPTGVRLSLVDPGTSPADVTAGRAARPSSTAHAAGPDVRSRADWGADESIRGGSPSYASRVRAVTVHHTASSSSYDRDDVPRLLRGFYAYHVKSNGWSDLGYNFLVDRFGTVWEGRAGGTGRPVIGAHAGGFNTGTVGVSMIGTYQDVTPSAAMLEGVAQVAGWKLGAAGVDPRGTVGLTSAGSTRFSSGTPVQLPTVFGHRDVSTTACPGVRGYAALGGVRERAAALAAGAVPLPAPVEEPAHDGTLRVEAPATADRGREVDVVVRGLPGRPVQLWFATADGGPASLRRNESLDATGTYRTTFPADGTHVLYAVSDDRTSARVTVRAGSPSPAPPPGPLTLTGPVTAAPGSTPLLTVSGPPGTGVTLWFRTPGEPVFVRRRSGVVGPDGTFTTTYTASSAQEVFAMSSTVTSADATVLLGPVPNGLHVTAPDAVEGGEPVPVVVQGTPGTAVEVWFARADGPFTRRRDGVLGPDGTFRTSYAGTDDHTVYAVAAGRTSTRTTTRLVGAAPVLAPADPEVPPVATAAPAGADAGAPVELTVSGPAGAGVDVWFRARGEQVFTKRRSGAFAEDGTYRTSYVGLDDQEYYATTGRAASRDAGTLLRPVVSAPASARLGSDVTLTGRARPGDTVLVEQRRRSSGAVSRSTATAGASGTFRLAVPLADESDVRASVGDRTGTAWATTKVSPTLVAPARSGRGSVTRLSGTARPGATVEVLFRKRGATVFTVGRRLVADASGRFSTTAVFATSHRAYARSDGLASPQRITEVR